NRGSKRSAPRAGARAAAAPRRRSGSRAAGGRDGCGRAVARLVGASRLKQGSAESSVGLLERLGQDFRGGGERHEVGVAAPARAWPDPLKRMVAAGERGGIMRPVWPSSS